MGNTIDLGREVVQLYGRLVREARRQSPFPLGSRAEFEAWQKRARRTMRQVLGKMPGRRVPLQLRRTMVERHPAYSVERLVFRTRPGLHATAYLLTPAGLTRPAPGVLALHGHSQGGKAEVLDPRSIYRGCGRRLAEAGCVTLCPDQIGFGERALPDGQLSYRVLNDGLGMLGHTLIGLRYWDLVRGLDLLAALDTVDPQRLGVMGLSLGGEMALFLAAGETRLRAACICGYLTSFASTFLRAPHCPCGTLRDLARHFEHADLAALIAPRPLLVDSGTGDATFPTAEARRTVRQLRPVYSMYGRPRAALALAVHPGGHEIGGAQDIPWLVRQLNSPVARDGDGRRRPAPRS